MKIERTNAGFTVKADSKDEERVLLLLFHSSQHKTPADCSAGVSTDEPARPDSAL